MKIKFRENLRLEITADVYISRYLNDQEAYKKERNMLHDIELQIKRHIDNVRHITFLCDTTYKCSFCNCIWETEDDGTPVCCQKAIDEFEREKQSAV